MTVRIGSVWEEAWSFARAEAALWVPVALACWGLPALIPAGAAVSPAAMAAGHVDPSFYFAMAVTGLASLFGQLALSALVLRRGETVGDALRTAGTRFPGALGTALAVGAAGMAYLLVVAVISLVFGFLREGAGGAIAASPGGMLAVSALLLPMLFVVVRLGTLWPTLVDRGRGGRETVLAAFGETRGVVWRLALLWLAYLLTLGLVLAAVNTGLGTLARLIALGLGAEAPGDAIVAVVGAAISAAANGWWALFVAHLHRRLAFAPSASRGFE